MSDTFVRLSFLSHMCTVSPTLSVQPPSEADGTEGRLSKGRSRERSRAKTLGALGFLWNIINTLGGRENWASSAGETGLPYLCCSNDLLYNR